MSPKANQRRFDVPLYPEDALLVPLRNHRDQGRLSLRTLRVRRAFHVLARRSVQIDPPLRDDLLEQLRVSADEAKLVNDAFAVEVAAEPPLPPSA
jgi:hypothetical protein